MLYYSTRPEHGGPEGSGGGKIAVEPAKNKGLIEIKGGIIQDWQGAVFIKGAKLDSVLRVVQDYANHAKYYSPDVVSSKVVSQTGDHWWNGRPWHRR